VEIFNKILKDHILHNITPLIETLFTINKLKRGGKKTHIIGITKNKTLDYILGTQ
jgi:hypothetical protein